MDRTISRAADSNPKTPSIRHSIRNSTTYPARVGRSSRCFASVLIRRSLRSALRATGSLKTRQNPSRTFLHAYGIRLFEEQTLKTSHASGFGLLRFCCAFTVFFPDGMPKGYRQTSLFWFCDSFSKNWGFFPNYENLEKFRKFGKI